jgi:hypothetical protein
MCSAEADPHVVADPSLLETFFEVLAELGEGDRQERFTLTFNSPRDRFEIARGAHAASAAQFFEQHVQKHDRALHLSPPFILGVGRILGP